MENTRPSPTARSRESRFASGLVTVAGRTARPPRSPTPYRLRPGRVGPSVFGSRSGLPVGRWHSLVPTPTSFGQATDAGGRPSIGGGCPGSRWTRSRRSEPARVPWCSPANHAGSWPPRPRFESSWDGQIHGPPAPWLHASAGLACTSAVVEHRARPAASVDSCWLSWPVPRVGRSVFASQQYGVAGGDVRSGFAIAEGGSSGARPRCAIPERPGTAWPPASHGEVAMPVLETLEVRPHPQGADVGGHR